MSPSNKVAAALAILVVLAIVAVIGAYDYGVSSQPITSETTSTATSLLTSVVTSLSTVTFTTTQFPNVPWNGDVTFMLGPLGGPVAVSFGNQLGDALLFDCTSAATTGCSVQEYDNSTGTDVLITARYPVVNQTGEPIWANCVWSAVELPSGPPLPGGPTFDYCIAIGSTAFVVAAPGPGPTK